MNTGIISNILTNPTSIWLKLWFMFVIVEMIIPEIFTSKDGWISGINRLIAVASKNINLDSD